MPKKYDSLTIRHTLIDAGQTRTERVEISADGETLQEFNRSYPAAFMTATESAVQSLTIARAFAERFKAVDVRIDSNIDGAADIVAAAR